MFMLKLLIFAFIFLTLSKAACPDGYFEWQTSCYFFNSTCSGFAVAEATCVENGGNLTSIHDGFVNSLLAQEAATYFHESTVTDFWIGLTNLMPGGNWTWMDGTKFDFSNWASGEPQNATGNNCAALSLNDATWKAEDCFKPKPFVCLSDKSAVEITTTTLKMTTTTTTKYPNCQRPFVYFEQTHSCYGVGNATGPLNWEKGEAYCISFDAHLTSIHSDAEYNFLGAMVYMAHTAFWTGAFSNDGGVSWKWSDETPWDYNPFWPGYPNLHATACGRIGGYGIADVNCTAALQIICKK